MPMGFFYGLTPPTAVILVRQNLTAIQMLTLGAGYALYFPLIVYLSANFSFHWALIMADLRLSARAIGC